LGQYVLTYVSDYTSHVGGVKNGQRLKELTCWQIFMGTLCTKNCLLPPDADIENPGYLLCRVGLAVGPPSGNRDELSLHGFCALSASYHDCTDTACSSTRILLPSLVSRAAIEVFQPASSSRLRYLSKVSLCIRSVSSRIMRVA
jgi:hypothetical protein